MFDIVRTMNCNTGYEGSEEEEKELLTGLVLGLARSSYRLTSLDFAYLLY